MAKLGFLFVGALLGILAIVAALGDVSQYIEMCRKEQKKTHQDVERIINTRVLDDNDEEAGCFIKCVGEKAGFVRADGNLDVGKNLELLRSVADAKGDKEAGDKAEAKIKACNDIKESNVCLKAIQLYKCLRAPAP